MAAALDKLASGLEQSNQLADRGRAVAEAAGLFLYASGDVGPPPGPVRVVLPPAVAHAQAEAQNLVDTGREAAGAARTDAATSLSRMLVPSIGSKVNSGQAEDWAHQTSGTSGSAVVDWLRTNIPSLMPDLGQIAVGTGLMALGLDMIGAAGAVEVGGAALDATLIGAAVGVPANVAGVGLAVAGAGVAAGGAAIAGEGIADLVSYARGQGGKFKGADAKASENEQALRAAKEVGIDTRPGRRALHDAISGQGYSYDQIKAIAQELYDNYPKYRSQG
jgi:hypothetical protein